MLSPALQLDALAPKFGREVDVDGHIAYFVVKKIARSCIRKNLI